MSKIGLAIPNFTLRRAGQRGAGGPNVRTEKEIFGQLEELEGAGVEYFIFNMPLSTVGQVRRVGEMLGGI